MSSPEEYVDGVEQAQQGESPRNGVDDDFCTSRCELEDYSSEEKQVDE